MSPPRFILAKYVPDLARMEPRNIGVIVWHNGIFALRFMESADAAAVGISDSSTYERWTAFWGRMANEGSIRPRRGKPVPADDPKCLDALVSTQKGNYILVDAGELLKPVRKKELGDVANYLFDDLVATRKQKKRTAAVTFRQACTQILERAEFDFRQQAPVDCVWGGVKRTLHPDYYIGNGSPDAIFERVELSSEVSVNASAMLVDALLDNGKVQRKACRFLVRSKDITSADASAGLALCESLCGYVDVDSENAVEAVREVVASIGARH